MSESFGSTSPDTDAPHQPAPHLKRSPMAYSTATDLRQDSDNTITCIVCLNDLPQDSIPVAGEYDPVARLVPCSHAMHNSCLVPWMERANSCPICRATFNEVSVSATLSGHILETYPVKDKIQATEYETEFLSREEEEGACEVCIRGNDEDVLLICDDCDRSYHTYCLGLDDIPEQVIWYCSGCSERHIAAQVAGRQRAQPGRRGIRTVGAIHRLQRQNQRDMVSREDRAWQNAWQRLDSDLEEHTGSASLVEQQIRSQRARQIERMVRRREVAAAQTYGGRNAFDEPLAWMIPTSRPRTFPNPQQPISEEEQSAWRMFDIAEGMEKSPRKRSRKDSQELTRSPVSDDDQKPRRKRPRTRRDSQLVEGNNLGSEPFSSTTALATVTRCSEFGSSVSAASGSYLGYILESIAKSTETTAPDPPQVGLWGIDLSKMRPLSPEPSNAASPRSLPTSPVGHSPSMMTSPPRSRPHSPIGTSRVPFPPSSPTRRIPIVLHTQSAPKRPWDLSPSSPPISRANSPIQSQQQRALLDEDLGSDDTRGGGSSSSDTDSKNNKKYRHHRKNGEGRYSAITPQVKTDIANMVRSVLKPLYPEKLSKDDFTLINKSVSRKLYQLVEADKNSDMAGDKEKWIKVVEEEVRLAVEFL